MTYKFNWLKKNQSIVLSQGASERASDELVKEEVTLLELTHKITIIIAPPNGIVYQFVHLFVF